MTVKKKLEIFASNINLVLLYGCETWNVATTVTCAFLHENIMGRIYIERTAGAVRNDDGSTTLLDSLKIIKQTSCGMETSGK